MCHFKADLRAISYILDQLEALHATRNISMPWLERMNKRLVNKYFWECGILIGTLMYSMFSKSISLNENQFCHYLNPTVFAWFHCPVYVRLNFAVNWNYNCTMEFNRILYDVAFEFPYPYDFTSFYFKSWTNQKFTNKILVKSCSTKTQTHLHRQSGLFWSQLCIDSWHFLCFFVFILYFIGWITLT